MRLFSKVVVVLVMLAFAASAVSAAQIVQDQTFSGKPDFSRTLTFNKFNANPGDTLNWIKVILSIDVDGGTYVLDNDAETAASGSFNFGGNCAITSASIGMLDANFLPVVGSVQAGHSQTFSLAANQDDAGNDWSSDNPDGMMYTGVTASDSRNGYIGSFLFSSYIGSGTYTVNIGATQWANYTGTSGIETATNPVNANGSVKIIYDYTPASVPEPATILGLISGLGMLGMLKRRK